MRLSLPSFKPLFSTALSTTLLIGITSCQDEDFGYAAEDIKYAKAYESFFGKMPADKNWDLSSYTNHYHYGEESPIVTRANGVTPTGAKLRNGNEYQVMDSYWEVPKKTYDWMKAALKEGKDNRYLGSPFVLQLPDNDFAIIPIFQGKSSIMSELEVKVNGYEITKVWTRSENIQVKDSKFSKFADSNGWMNIGFYDGYSGYDQTTMKREGDACLDNGNRDWSKLPMHPSYTDESEAVRSKPIYFHAKERIGKSDKGFMYLSLHNIAKAWASWTNYEKFWDENNEWTTNDHRLTSINPNGHMLALNVPSQYRPSPNDLPNISSDGTKPSQVIFVSCEDANGTSTDHDVNDVAFLIIGYPNAPTIVPTTEVIKKRYMCEDLGGTYDYDFNDIVVDVTQTQKYTVQAVPDALAEYNPSVAGNITITDMVKDGCPVQTAKVAHLCGTIPVQIQIGSFMFPKIKNPRNNADADGAGTDGKYSTRVELMSNEYYLYHHAHCSSCGDDHTNPTEGQRVQYGHKNFTRSGEEEHHNTTKGWNPNEEQIIPCHTWDPDANNIVIYADWGFYKKMYTASSVNSDVDVRKSNPFPENTKDFADFASGKKFAVAFPKTGEYPYIIATDQDVPWMKESQHIPEAWVNGDMTARSDNTGSNHDLIGNSFYMENYGLGDHFEGYIWSGDVTGLAGSTGVTFAKPSAELNALDEAFGTLNGGHWYYLLHVYADVPAGEMAYIGLYDPQTWKPILDSDPDGYLVKPIEERLHHTELGVDGLQCATIYLTQEQRDYILAHGLTIASRTDGVRIKKVTTARPCLYNEKATGTSLDGGFIVIINKEEVLKGGWVLSDESVRQQDIIKKEDGKNLTSEQEAHNAAEPARAAVPFTRHQFISGTTVTLTAIGAAIDEEHSYRVTGWVVDSNTSDFTVSNTSSNPLTITCNNTVGWAAPKEITVYPTFASATNPKLKWEENPTEANKTITLALNGSATCKIYATSLNMSSESMLDQFGGNTNTVGASFGIEGGKHVITLTPKAVGETTFTIYQKDGEYNGKNYGVSSELKLTVKVIESIPTSLQPLSTDDIFAWSGFDDNAYIVARPSWNLVCNTTSATIADPSGEDPTTKTYAFGDWWGQCDKYVDLPNAHKLVIGVKSGDPEIAFNATETYGGHTMVDAKHEACTVVENGTYGKVYIIDLDKVRNGKNYLHLDFIRAKSTAESIELYSIEVDSKESRVVNNYNRVQAVKSWTDLGIGMFHKYSDTTGATTVQTSSFGEEYHVGESADNVYGHGSVPYDCYALLDGNTILKLEVEEGEPRILLNRKENEDFIEITPSKNADWIYKVGNVYYVMLWPLQEIMHENIRLNAIKGANYSNVKVTSLQVGKP